MTRLNVKSDSALIKRSRLNVKTEKRPSHKLLRLVFGLQSINPLLHYTGNTLLRLHG